MEIRTTVLLILAGLADPAEGALTWSQPTIAITAEPLAEKAEAVFSFVNSGDRPVTIVGAHSSCGCTVPELTKREFAPGEAGEVRAVFTFEGREGRQEKLIDIVTDEPGGRSYVLQLIVEIPRLFEVRPRFVIWRQGEEPRAKSIEVEALQPGVVAPAAVESRDARFAVRLEPDAAKPGLFRVWIEPQRTDTPMQASVIVRMDKPAGDPHLVTLYALVR